ncbi:helix-turn-helix domain-containing protein [Nocardia sp. NPDC058480]|uniref:helix-turn-helix domain-containing protein n=1 Tax=Nocardia sp. NPDC058480 TaxID=3346522 RepID=UPI00365F6459
MSAGDDRVAPGAAQIEAAQKAVAAHLRAERARADLKQSELAAAAGLSTNTISRIETGTRDMTLSQLVAISAALGVSAGAFIDAAQASMK